MAALGSIAGGEFRPRKQWRQSCTQHLSHRNCTNNRIKASAEIILLRLSYINSWEVLWPRDRDYRNYRIIERDAV